jgi:hypothetical protein
MIAKQNSVFIDPENCGSSIGYYITIEEYTPKDKPTQHNLRATVVLADCTHKIDWSFGDEEGVEKIDEAIRMLQEFRKQYVETLKLTKKLNK